MDSISSANCETLLPTGELKPLDEIERSIIKKYRKHLWSKFIKAIKDFKLIEEGDKIAVAISGGKDSMLMAKLFQELQKHGDMKIDLEFIVADPGYHEQIRELMIKNCEYLNIPIKIFDSGIFKIVDKIAKDYPCYMCAKMRRGALYSKAQELGCNKLALGHHFNDIIETTMMNILYTGSFKTMLPKLHSTNFKDLELIRPMYYIEEKHIERFTQNSGIMPLNCACMVAAERTGNKRYEIKNLIKELSTKIDNLEINIMRAAQNVNMEAILGWQKGGKTYSYLDFYDEYKE
ncbi:tRNA 2-thiocytidine biosynthesis TtcA family protein [Lutispora thermophila]|uniref:tRNA(Ile)-lysidine synthase TilS/MesJ n=1 Tax=Lutispora thermophila DSM 19022 TaxID=1122184 RepID=A0A1M6CD68_9FIRM|nr:ATP-binding protein [Lutispora thermophila]SHI58704.1 tRNA(Ile)-lysidine synthase TilS/MesJ [Lutispora thermophila DSM 19022]